MENLIVINVISSKYRCKILTKIIAYVRLNASLNMKCFASSNKKKLMEPHIRCVGSTYGSLIANTIVICLLFNVQSHKKLSLHLVF
jgi:hypothetical protein